MQQNQSKTDSGEKQKGQARLRSSDLFDAMAALMATCREPVGRWVKTNPTLLHTKNLFGPPEEIAGKILRLIERNDEGDCLCIFNGKAGTNIVDVDHRDIAPNDQAERKEL